MMNRRDILMAAAALGVSPLLMAGTAAAKAADPLVYSPEALAAELAAGKAVVLDFAASWCPSCLAQGRAIQALRAENPAYDAGLVFMVADWDTWKDKDIAQRLGVTGRGAVVILKGDAIVARSDQHLQKAQMQAFLDQVLAVTA
jgi:thioredoxin 1